MLTEDALLIAWSLAIHWKTLPRVFLKKISSLQKLKTSMNLLSTTKYILRLMRTSDNREIIGAFVNQKSLDESVKDLLKYVQ